VWLLLKIAENLMNAFAEAYRQWEELLKAYDDHCSLSDISYAVKHLHSLMEGPDKEIQSPISAGLRDLIGRTRELSDAFENYEEEIENSYQDAAWRYSATGYGIHIGNRIEFTDWRGRVVIGSARQMRLRERSIGELTLEVLLLRKDGSVGKKQEYIQVAQGKWKNLDQVASAPHANHPNI
jgi:regulator of protease activity HflC (stomatin/prohibitin superfamily)